MKQRGDTIAAIATAPGRGAIGIVRVSGSELVPLIEGVLGMVPQPRRAVLAAFRDENGAAIDRGIALRFRAPHSYTGEDMLELHGHGGAVVLARLLRRCVALGARVAEPGEFTKRAFLNDKIDLAEAESVADLIDATTDRAAKCAARSLTGEFSQAVDSLAIELRELRALVEATLDFPDEEIDFLQAVDAPGRLARIRGKLAGTMRAARQGSVLRDGIQVVLVGRPNVGKSSILNRLAREEVAIVTDVPGTTRDAIRQPLQIQGVPLHIVDTAGLRASEDPVELVGMARTRSVVEGADVAVLVREVNDRDGRESGELADLTGRLQRIDVVNKIDLVHQRPRVRSWDGGVEIHLSARTGEGIPLLEGALLDAVGWENDHGDGIFMARARHLEALRATEANLSAAEEEVASTELLAERLRQAQEALSSISGARAPEALLDDIFSRFCIGK